MTSRGVDYSWSRPGGAAIKAAGFDFVMRYVPYPGDGGKGLTLDELRDLAENGLPVGLVFESTAGRMFDGYPAGEYDAQIAAAASDKFGLSQMAIYFACDVDTQPDTIAYIDDYLAGAASVLGIMRVGVYGEYDVVEHCHEVGSAVWYWQTYAWSGGQKSSWRHIYQYENGQTLNGGAVDYNEAYGEFGQWTPEEEEMTPEQVEAIVTKVIGRDFSEYLEEYFAGHFSERNGVVSELNPEGRSPIRPWLEDIAARVRTVPGIAHDE